MSSSYYEASKAVEQPVEIDDAMNKEVAIEQDVVSLPPPPVTDGGLRAWLQVMGCFLVFFNVW
jgi:hypothetical protein